MEAIANVTYKLRATPELVRIRSGFLIKDILERTAKKINGTLEPTERSLYMYSAHSSTLATMLNGFGLNEVKYWNFFVRLLEQTNFKRKLRFQLNLPPYASSLHYELLKTSANKYYLQFIYRKPDVEHPKPMIIPGIFEISLRFSTLNSNRKNFLPFFLGCGEKWTLEQFYSVHEKIIPGDFDTECKVEGGNE